MDERETVELLREHFSVAKPSVGGPICVYLFGSFARGTAAPTSDVDVAVLYDGTLAPSLSGPAVKLEEELEQLLGRRVQVVLLDAAPADLVHRVLRDGKLLYESDRSRRIRFEVAARSEYFDLLPILRRYRQRARP